MKPGDCPYDPAAESTSTSLEITRATARNLTSKLGVVETAYLGARVPRRHTFDTTMRLLEGSR